MVGYLRQKWFGLLRGLLLVVFWCLASCGGGLRPVNSPVQPEETVGVSTQDEADQANLPERTGKIHFTQTSVEDGLSESVVNTILQDHLGFLWFGTADGLNKYDGYFFKVFKHESTDPNSLSQSYITSLCEDHSGALWAGTLTEGLNRYDRKTGSFTHYQHDPDNPDSLSGDRINILYVDRDGNLWIGTNATGLDRFDPQTGKFFHYKNNSENTGSLGHNVVLAIYQDREGMLWVGTQKGLDRFDPQTGIFTHYRHDPNNPSSLSSNVVQAIYEDRFGTLWIGTAGGGLNWLDRSTGVFTRFLNILNISYSLSSNNVRTIWEDRAGVFWIGTIGGGLNRFDRQTGRFFVFRRDPWDPNSLSDDRIFSMVEDNSGILWLGTYGGGINKIESGYKQFTHYYNHPRDANSLSRNQVFSICTDPDGSIWVGTDGGGLNRLDLQTGRFFHYLHRSFEKTSLSSNSIHALLMDEDGVLWVGTTAGLNSLDVLRSNFTQYSTGADDLGNQAESAITALAKDQEGFLWIGTNGDGLVKFDRKSGQFVDYYFNRPSDPFSLGNNYIWTVYVDSANEVWVGTAFGLDHLNPKTGQFTHYRSDPDDPASLSDNYVMSLYEDKTGNLWIGTTGGLNKLDRGTGIFKQYHMKDGLPNEYIYSILEDNQGYFWMSSNRGLARFNPQTETFQNYDALDGLQSNEFNVGAFSKSTNGQLFFGGINGLTAFFPEDIRKNPYVPPVVLTSLSIRGSDVTTSSAPETTDSITLRWPNNHFEFGFSALSYSRPEKNQYAYKLQGFDQEWNYIGNRHEGGFTNLPGKTYTLLLKGANDDGVWNQEGAVLQVKVIPPFWQTWWFRGVVALFVVVGIAGGYRVRVKSIELRNIELERQVNERTREIELLFEQTKELAVIEERNRLARDLHDSAKQKAFAALAQLGAARSTVRQDPARARAQLDEAENLVYEVIQELTFLIQEMYPLALKEKGLVTALREYIFEWENRADIQVNFLVDGEKRLPLQFEQAIYRVAQESLANVSRHSKASRVKISLSYNTTVVDMIVADNGCGFDLNQKPCGVGLRSMQERVAMIQGSLDIQSVVGQGTQIIVHAPIPSELPEVPINSTNGGRNGQSNHRNSGR